MLRGWNDRLGTFGFLVGIDSYDARAVDFKQHPGCHRIVGVFLRHGNLVVFLHKTNGLLYFPRFWFRQFKRWRLQSDCREGVNGQKNRSEVETAG